MRGALGQMVAVVTAMGGFGLLLVTALDSSILFLPFSMDLLVILFAAQGPVKGVYYAVMATIGSVVGTMFIDWVARKGGEHGLKRFADPRRLAKTKKKIETNGGRALAIAAIMPPPFPYRVFVAVAAALGYSWKKMLMVTAVSRLIRFSAEAVLAVFYGRAMVQFMKNSDGFYYGMLILTVASIAGTALAIYTWVRRK